MVLASFSLREDYWENFKLQEEDIEFIYNYLLETETPLTPEELVEALVVERIRQEKLSIEKQRSSGGDLYLPEVDFPCAFMATGRGAQCARWAES
jgi:hypothetical protein